jgi:hypothetical protein
MRASGRDGTRLAILARMFRRLPLLSLLVAVTGCAGGLIPIKIRPGSNVALPDDRSWIGDLVGAVACSKSKDPRKGTQCGQARIDSIPQRGDTLPTPPAKRP